MRIAPESTGTDPSLNEHGAELRAAMARALAAEGFRVVDRGGLVVTTSIDYSAWTSVTPASLYIVVKLQNEGVPVDQVEVQKLNEAFPEPARVEDLAHALAHALATSPRLRDFLSK